MENGRIAHQGSLPDINSEHPDIVTQWTNIIQQNRYLSELLCPFYIYYIHWYEPATVCITLSYQSTISIQLIC